MIESKRGKIALVSVLIITLLIVIVINLTSSQTIVTSIIREDCTGYSNCFTSLYDWERLSQRDLTTINGGEIEHVEIQGTWNNPDTNNFVIEGWTTDAQHYINITTVGAARHSGVWNNSAYRIESGSGAWDGVIGIRENFVTIEGLQITNTNNYKGIGSDFALGNIVIKENIVRAIPNSYAVGISLPDSGNNANNFVINNIVYGFDTGIYVRGLSAGIRGIVYSNTVFNAVNAYRCRGSFSILKNNLAFNSTNFVLESNSCHLDSDNNAGNSATGPVNDVNYIDISSYTGTELFADYNNKNFHLASESYVIDRGTDLSSDLDYAFSDDIDGDARESGAWDIGADESDGVSCVPTTCFALGYECGSGWPNGCGGTLDCDVEIGGCTGTDICSSGSCVPASSCVDNDGDGYNTTSACGGVSNIDCDDSVTGAGINPGATEVCDDSVDNNCINGIDCSDSSCSSAPNCQTPPQCSDGIDNDGDLFCDTAGSGCTDGTPGDPDCSGPDDISEFPQSTLTSNYPLEIISPQEGLSTSDCVDLTLPCSRYYRAYPGIEYKVPVGVFGGLYPFTYALTSSPIGMNIDSATGVITWTPPDEEGTIYDVTVQVTDENEDTDSHSWTIIVTTLGFVFVDASVGDGGTGTLSDPFNSMVDIYEGTNDEASFYDTYDGYFVYWREGTYELEGVFDDEGTQQHKIAWKGVKPKVWLGYPRETVVIDHDLGSGGGAYFDMKDGNHDDTFIHNINFQDMLNHATRIGGDRITYFENTFSNLGPGVDGHNSAYIMTVSGGGLAEHNFMVIKDNHFGGSNQAPDIKLYMNHYMVIEGNTFIGDVIGGNLNPGGLAIKAGVDYLDVRSNTWDGIFVRGAISGNWANCNEMEFRFNNIKNARSTSDYSAGENYGALTINYHGNAGLAYIYRNTFEGIVMLRRGYTGNGPFIFYNNVIVNEDTGYIPDSHIHHFQEGGSVDNHSVVIIRQPPNDNLAGYAIDGIIDVNGDLTSAYSSYLGTHGYQISDSGLPPICVHEADDSPCDGCVDLGELQNYIDRWLADSTDVTIEEAASAIEANYAGSC